MPAEIKEVVVLMKLVGELKDKVEKAENQEEAKKVIEEAGMELTDEELDAVSGGAGGNKSYIFDLSRFTSISLFN